MSSLGGGERRTGHVDLVAVTPEHRRGGVGRRLLAGTERLLAAGGATEVRLAANPPYYAWPGVDVRYTPAVCLARRAGYHQDRTAWNMTVELTGTDGSPRCAPPATPSTAWRPPASPSAGPCRPTWRR